MRTLLICLLLLTGPARAAMDITRELVGDDRLVPGQPLRVAVTYWTDSWFNPPPQWPDFPVSNGTLLPAAIPNQLVSRQRDGVSWSGIRMERQLMAWDQGKLQLPALDITLQSAGQPPQTVALPALEKRVRWPPDVQQPDRFLPAATLYLQEKVTLYRAAQGDALHAGDVVERQITLQASGVVAGQIPPVLIDLPGASTQLLTPEVSALTSGRGEITGSQRRERLRYLPDSAGSLTLPPVQLRWWDTRQQTWQLATLPAHHYDILPARPAGSEQVLRAGPERPWWQWLLLAATVVLLVAVLWAVRRLLRQALMFAGHAWSRLWRIHALPDLVPHHRSRR